MVAPAPPRPVPGNSSRPTTRSSTAIPSNNLAVPGPSKLGTSPMSYGLSQGMSFTNAGMSLEKGNAIGGATPKSYKWGGPPGSHGARFYGDGVDAQQTFSTSVTMEPSSFIAAASAFNLPSSSSLSSSYRRSYAAAARGDPSPSTNMLSSSLASMSMSLPHGQPMSFGTSWSKSQVHSLMAARSDAELTQSYECCGETHSTLHALLEHVEDAHPFSDPIDPTSSSFSPQVLAMDMDLEGLDGMDGPGDKISNSSSRSSLSPPTLPIHNYPLPPSAPVGDKPLATSPLPLQISELLKSPPDGESVLNAVGSRSASTCSSPPEGSLATPTTSTQPSPVFAAPKLTPRGPASFWGGPIPRDVSAKRFDRAFNEVVAAKPTASIGIENKTSTPTAVAPGVLFASAVAGLGIPTTCPVPGQKPAVNVEGEPVEEEDENAEASGSKSKLNDVNLPQPSLFSSHKPWRCPNPGCNKAYRQSNGLKYHQQKGQCDYGLFDAADLGLSVEEAEIRSRPFICAVGAGCTKRYRQMNGLKYHYLNSGEHGQYGLRMIQNGTHPNPLPTPSSSTTSTPTFPSANAVKKPIIPGAPSHPTSAITANRPAVSAPYTIPNRPGGVPSTARPLPRMGVFPNTNNASRGITGVKTTPNPLSRMGQLPPIQRGRDAVLFSTVGFDTA